MKNNAIIPVCTLLGLLFCTGNSAAGTTLELVTNSEPQRVFFGAARELRLTWRNASDQDYEGAIRARVFQTSSATAVLSGEVPWKTLRVLPRQTVVETAQLDFPAVKTGTRFLVRWLEHTNQVIGTTEVWVYPTNLLAELKPLAGDELLGVFDPLNQLKPRLHQSRVDFADLENSDLETFSGKLAVVGPFYSKAQMRDGLANQIKALAKKGIAIVWMRPPPERRETTSPSFYSVPENTNAVVVVRSDLIPDLPDNPQAQLELIYFCRLALNPRPLILPDLTKEP